MGDPAPHLPGSVPDLGHDAIPLQRVIVLAPCALDAFRIGSYDMPVDQQQSEAERTSRAVHGPLHSLSQIAVLPAPPSPRSMTLYCFSFGGGELGATTGTWASFFLLDRPPMTEIGRADRLVSSAASARAQAMNKPDEEAQARLEAQVQGRS